ncbi:hypothetical protein, partial [Streptomyces sp. NPDC007000]|uniref:hypothetical protein n=1 Tax=Streptomyces sp. NPDC007000 TaxID=3155357 RepID=UPI0033D7F336
RFEAEAQALLERHAAAEGGLVEDGAHQVGAAGAYGAQGGTAHHEDLDGNGVAVPRAVARALRRPSVPGRSCGSRGFRPLTRAVVTARVIV